MVDILEDEDGLLVDNEVAALPDFTVEEALRVV